MKRTIIAFDPGLSNLGVSVFQWEDENINLIDIDIHKQKSKEDIGEKLLNVHQFINNISREYDPAIMAYEKMFFRGRSDSAASTIKVIGLIELIAEERGIKSIGVSPPTLKKFITGNGRANKDDMKRVLSKKVVDMLSLNWNEQADKNPELLLKSTKISNHEIDAFAVGLWAHSQVK